MALTVRRLMALILFLVVGLWFILRIHQRETVAEVRVSIDFLVREAERSIAEVEEIEAAIQNYHDLWMKALENPSTKQKRLLQLVRRRFADGLKTFMPENLPASLRRSLREIHVLTGLYFEETESTLSDGLVMEGRKERINRLHSEILGEIGNMKEFYQQKLGPIVEHGRRVVQGEKNKDLIFLSVSLAALAGIVVTIWFLVGAPLMELSRGVKRLAYEEWEGPVPVRGFGEVAGLIRAFNRMAETIERQKALLVEEATTDELTGLLNFRAFQERFQTEIERSRRLRKPVSLVLADIDYFKDYNDRYGHLAGNEMLRKIAALFKRGCRRYDLVARFGGEEFAIVLPETDNPEAVKLAERLRRTMVSDGVDLTLSCGVATFPSEADDLKGLIAKADDKLYRAKDSGRNRVVA